MDVKSASSDSGRDQVADYDHQNDPEYVRRENGRKAQPVARQGASLNQAAPFHQHDQAKQIVKQIDAIYPGTVENDFDHQTRPADDRVGRRDVFQARHKGQCAQIDEPAQNRRIPRPCQHEQAIGEEGEQHNKSRKQFGMVTAPEQTPLAGWEQHPGRHKDEEFGRCRRRRIQRVSQAGRSQRHASERSDS